MKLILYIISLSIFTLISCKSVQEPIYLGTENLRLNSLGFKQSSVKADIKFFNPNTKSLQFKSADIDVFLQERLLGKIILDTLITMPPKDTIYIPVNGAFAIKDVLSNAPNILLMDSINVKVHGNLRAGMNGFYKNVPVHYEGKQPTDKLFENSNK